MCLGRQSWPQGIMGNWSDLIRWPCLLLTIPFNTKYCLFWLTDGYFLKAFRSVFLLPINRFLRRNFISSATSQCQPQTVPTGTEILQVPEENGKRQQGAMAMKPLSLRHRILQLCQSSLIFFQDHLAG